MLTRTPGGMAGTDSHPSDTTLPNQNLSDATLSNQNVPNKNVSDNDAARPPALRLRSGVREQGGGPGAVSLAEFPSPQRDEDRRPSGLDRLPPQDVAAEQCVLGSMLLSKDAIADVVELLMGNDFYRPAHETVYDAIIDLYGRGEPADAVTVSAELSRRNELTRIGGASYLHTLIASVPSAANAGYYAEIVHEKATLRRLVGAGTKIVQLGYAGEGDVDSIVDAAQAEIYRVSEKRASEDYMPLSDIMEATLDEIEAASSRGGQLVGVPTGFADLDRVTTGLHSGQLIVVAARPGIGKALALDTPLPTPTGWTTMGEVAVGDALIGADGRPTQVVAATDVMTDRPCYEVEFSDGSVVVADAEHQWVTTTRAQRVCPSSARAAVDGGTSELLATMERAQVATTVQLAGALRNAAGDEGRRPEVALAAAFQLPTADLPMPAYVLGLWLGDTSPAASRYRSDALDALGVVARKHIPPAYLRASESQRRALLAGLLASGGSPSSDGSIVFEACSADLATGVRELVHSLGLRATPGSLVVAYSDQARTVTDVRKVASVPVRCVQVVAADHLYLAGRSCIPTHNSTLGLDFARSCSIKHGMTSVIFSLEMGRTEITMRLLAAEAKVSMQHMRQGSMSNDDWSKLAAKMAEVSEAPLFIDDSPNMTMMEIRAKCRRLKQRNNLKLVVVDYLQLMSSGKKVESRQQEVAEFSRSLKLLAKELEVPVVAISQLNRGAEQRTDKKPMLSDLRESGAIEQDADMVILLHRDDQYERESTRPGEADFILAKHRNGPLATITTAFQGHYSRFVDMASG